MKISAVPPVVQSMTMATTHPNAMDSTPVQELSNPDVSETREAEASQPLSPQYARIAKERRALQLQRRAFEEEKKALANAGTGSDRIDIARLKSQPLSVLQEAGVTYDQLTEHLLASQEDSKVRALEEKIEALQKGLDQKFSDRDAQAEKQVLSEMKREAEKLAFSDNAFELVRETKSIPAVMSLIERTYRETGEVLDVSEAMSLVEDELFNDATKLAGLNKIRSQFQQQLPQPQQQRGMRTLKNSDTSSIPLSRRARALAAWNR